MNILGITFTTGEPSAAFLVDGELVRFAAEERFVRVKKAKGIFPHNAINYCVGTSKVDAVAIGWDTHAYPTRVKQHLEKNAVCYNNNREWDASLLARYNPDVYVNKITKELSVDAPIEFFPHHLSHAAASFYSSGFDEAACIVIDGHGEENCTSIFSAGKSIEPIGRINIPHSLGWIYGAITEYLGFERNCEEGSVMALAALGTHDEHLRRLMSDIIKLDEWYTTNPFYFAYGEKTDNVPDRLIRALGGHTPEDIAFALQSRFSEVIRHLATRAFEMVGTKNVCLSGGVCLNCKMNGSLLGLADSIFVQPASSDEGVCIGAAMLMHKKLTDENPEPPDSVYLGPNCGDPNPYHNNVIASMLNTNRIIGRACGRMEMGPRALGNRSILANPLYQVRDRLNKIKGRQKFRPVCPVMTDKSAHKYLVESHPCDHMTIAFTATDYAKENISDAVHFDGTVRPQILRKEHNPVFYDLLVKFGEYSGHEVLINTSLNKKGDPIVCTAEDAREAGMRLNLDMIQIGEELCQLRC